MKGDYRDALFASLGLLLTLGLALLAMGFVAPILERPTGRLYALAYGFAFLLTYGLIATAYVRLLLRLQPFQEGVYGLDHPQFLLWKHCAMMNELARATLGFLNLAPTRVLYYRLLGVQIGEQVGIGKVNITDPWFTRLDDLAVIGDGSTLAAHAIAPGRFTLGRVRIGPGATVGVGAFVMPGAEVGEGSLIGALSRVNPGTRIPPGELWDGIPAAKVRELSRADSQRS